MTGRTERTGRSERAPAEEGRVLVAGVGNIFLGDDGFGVEAVRRLAGRPLPDDVEVLDVGVRGVHLAYQLLDGYRMLVLVDATARGGEPGTVYLIEPDAGPVESPGGEGPGPARAPVLDGHRMGPDAVLALLSTLAAGTGGTAPERVLVVGCEPASLEEGIGLSAPVAAAVEEAVGVILRVVGADTHAKREASPC
ncbi:hydrogenase maturation protease [Kitasatospora sp. A2-31]|uniref:hydrogenase maturation protease n=1 Tax=Kitasatospora sp. A2-31 TaxID=2916414 RepID=UPI001EEF44CC|nr:hydrogenase maturation protease [Kitasatospora sp. A2-31]MCG6498866.1 hydrogenase maturation protease [Kitasatospora sp. A2-31]